MLGLKYSGVSANNAIIVVRNAIDDTTHKSAKNKQSNQKKKTGGELMTNDILRDQIKSYKSVIRIDTSFSVNGKDTIRVLLRHYCTYDSKINVPSQYLKLYGLTKFKTHDFVSSLIVKVNSKTIFKGAIKKDNFNKVLDDKLIRYGVLISPNVEFVNDSLAVQYSISIPLTDIGKGVKVSIDTSGKAKFGEN